MLSFFRFLRGYLLVRVWGYSPERFLNLCSNHNISVWNILPGTEYYEMYMDLRGFLKIRPIARKTKTKVAIQKRFGLPFFIAAAGRRKMFFAGLAGCFISLILLSHFVWAIELEGNTTLTRDLFLDFLTENNIGCGTGISNIDIDKLEKVLRNEYGYITWASARIEGTKLVVRIKENEMTETPPEKGANSDLIAPADGMIISIVTRSGIPKVIAGDMVEKEQVLISGAIPIVGDYELLKGYRYCDADGDVWIQRIYPYEDHIKYEYEQKNYSGEEIRVYFVQIGGMYFHFFREPAQGTYDMIADEKQLKLLEDFYLPVYFGKKTFREFATVRLTRDKEDLTGHLKKNLNKFCATLEEKGVQIIQKDVRIENGNNGMYLRGSVWVNEKVTLKQPVAQIEIPPENEPVGEEETSE